MTLVYEDTKCSVSFITLYQVQIYCLHKDMLHILRTRGVIKSLGYQNSKTIFLNRRAAAQYRALASIIPGRERLSWNR